MPLPASKDCQHSLVVEVGIVKNGRVLKRCRWGAAGRYECAVLGLRAKADVNEERKSVMVELGC